MPDFQDNEYRTISEDGPISDNTDMSKYNTFYPNFYPIGISPDDIHEQKEEYEEQKKRYENLCKACNLVAIKEAENPDIIEKKDNDCIRKKKNSCWVHRRKSIYTFI